MRIACIRIACIRIAGITRVRLVLKLAIVWMVLARVVVGTIASMRLVTAILIRRLIVHTSPNFLLALKLFEEAIDACEFLWLIYVKLQRGVKLLRTN